MESFEGAPVFIDVERTQQYILTEEMCNVLMQQRQKEGQEIQSVSALTQNETSEVQNEKSGSQPETSGQETVSSQAKEKPMQIGADAVAGQSGKQKDTTATEANNSLLKLVPRRIRCPECHRYTAENEEKMLRHIKKVHLGENPFQCYMCDYNTYNKSLFEEHVRIHQGIKPFKCSHCDYKSASKKNLKKHELIHRPSNPLKCDMCEFIARHTRALTRHKESHISGEWLKFDSCKFKFRDLAGYEQHKKTHRSSCKLCEFTTCSKPLLKRHLREVHNMREDEMVKKENFTCQICGWMSSTMAKILLHLIHHPKQTVDESVIDISILRKHGIMT